VPRQPQTAEVREAARERILDEALALFAEGGFEQFSMRRLGARLDVAAKTIYNYFASKDEIYLGLLTRGFVQLSTSLRTAIDEQSEPWDRLEAVVATYVDFGLTYANVYNLMFTWHVPKFEDYVGTDLEAVALVELEAALENQRLVAAVLSACSDGPLGDDDLRFLTVWLWTQLHGYVAGINNTLLGYMHPEPLAIRARLTHHVVATMKDVLTTPSLVRWPATRTTDNYDPRGAEQ
jgi:AcrR family transcriptional regulator